MCVCVCLAYLVVERIYLRVVYFSMRCFCFSLPASCSASLSLHFPILFHVYFCPSSACLSPLLSQQKWANLIVFSTAPRTQLSARLVDPLSYASGCATSPAPSPQSSTVSLLPSLPSVSFTPSSRVCVCEHTRVVCHFDWWRQRAENGFKLHCFTHSSQGREQICALERMPEVVEIAECKWKCQRKQQQDKEKKEKE